MPVGAEMRGKKDLTGGKRVEREVEKNLRKSTNLEIQLRLRTPFLFFVIFVSKSSIVQFAHIEFNNNLPA